MSEVAYKDTIESIYADYEIVEQERDFYKDKSMRLEQADNIRRAEGRKRAQRKAKSRYFTKAYHCELRDLLGTMSDSERSLFLVLSVYLEKDTGYIVKGGKRLSQNEIATLSNWKVRRTRDILNSLVDKETLFVERNGTENCYKMNPRYVFVGTEEDNNWRDLVDTGK